MSDHSKEMTHDVMHAASRRRVSGDASDDQLAAGGGLEVPARVAQDASVPVEQHHELIPGERDLTNLTARQPGAMGGRFSGADNIAPDPGTMDEETRREHEREGSGEVRKESDRGR